MKIRDADVPLRPGYGNTGKHVVLRTNFFPVSIPKGRFYEYRINITPLPSSTRVKRRIFELAEGNKDWQATLAGSVAHDRSAKLVVRQRLPLPLTIRVPYYYEDEDPPTPETPATTEYVLAIEFVRELETDGLRRLDHFPGFQIKNNADSFPQVYRRGS